MAFLQHDEMFLLFTVFLIYIAMVVHRRRHLPITNWPFFGMTPEILLNVRHIHDLATHILKLTHGTYMVKGIWFTNGDMLFTSDPANIHYMLSKNFQNYPKGPEFRTKFDIFGDGIFTSDHHLWEFHRKTTMSILKQPNFNAILETTIRNKIDNGLLPLLDFVSSRHKETDLQDILQRFTFDTICLVLLNYDPQSLSLNLPTIPCNNAFTVAHEALLWRNVVPEKIWKLQRRFEMGMEKKMKEASKAIDEFLYMCLSRKQDNVPCSLLPSFVKSFEGKSGTSGDSRKFLKDIVLNLMFAGRDTISANLSWFFYLLAQNPSVEEKIREEIGGHKSFLGVNELEEMSYLHGSICEALRLYPPIALDYKSPFKADVLPSGHVVDARSKIILAFYSMGRMESIWGNDCMEFKPERWLSNKGKIKHVPSYKFTAFNAGPRTCLGKDMALIQMKMVAIAIISNYRVELVKGHEVRPNDSIILQMKYGLKVKLFPINTNNACT